MINMKKIVIIKSKIKVPNPFNETGKSKYIIDTLYFNGQNFFIKPYKKYDRMLPLNSFKAKWAIEGKYKI